MYVSTDEQETTINILRSEKDVHVWTSDSTMMTRLDKACELSEHYSVLKTDRFKDGSIASKEYYIDDKRLVSFRLGRRENRNMTDEEKQATAERLRKARQNSQN